MPFPIWMCGAVTSIPSFTRSGRPSCSFCSSAPCGSTSTAFRVRSATLIGASLLSDGAQVLDLDRLELVGRLEAEDLREERDVRFERALHVLRLAETMPLPLEGDVREGDSSTGERLHDDLRLRRGNDLVV